jgi:signal transduction histidine kinase
MTRVTTIALKKVLRESELFKDLSDEELDRITQFAHEVTFEAGDIMFREDDVAEEIYIVSQGKVAIEMGLHLGGQVRRPATIETVTGGYTAGWTPLAGARMRIASGRCVVKTTAVALSGEALLRLFEEDNKLGLRMMHKLVNLVCSRLESVRDTLVHILSIASHDLKAPLNAVQSYHQVMLGGYAGEITEKQRNMLLRSGERILGLLGLIDNILDISRLGAGDLKKETVSLIRLGETCLEDVRAQATEKGIQLVTDWPVDLPRIQAQPVRLQQAMTNLLANAVRFTGEGGKVTLRMKDAGNEVAVEVMDTGPGIPEDELPRIFDDFYRGKNAQAGGIGLGLSIAKRIVEDHGGRIWPASPYPESNKGAKFTFTLPKD